MKEGRRLAPRRPPTPPGAPTPADSGAEANWPRRLRDAVLTAPLNEDRTILGAPYDAEGRLVRIAQRWAAMGNKPVDPETLPERGAGEELRRGTYLGHFFRHFGHFLVETLPSLFWADKVKGPLLFHPYPVRAARPGHRAREAKAAMQRALFEPTHVRFFLDALEISPDRIHLVLHQTRVLKLGVVPRPAFIVGETSAIPYETVYRRIRDRVLQAAPAAGPERLYLSRARLEDTRQRVAEEPRIEAVFAEFGFAVLHPQEWPIDQQIRHVAAARWLAGLEGSALHLAAFTRPGTRMVMLHDRPFRPGFGINKAAGVETVALNQSRMAADPALLRAELARLRDMDFL